MLKDYGFAFVSLAWGDISNKILLQVMAEIFLPMFSSRILMVWGAGDDMEKSQPSCTNPLLVGIQTGVATVENSTEIPQIIKNGSAFSPSNPTSGDISKGAQSTNSKEHKHSIAALFTIAKIWKQPKCPSLVEWIKQLWDFSQ